MTVLEETTGEPTAEPSEPTDARGRVAELHEIRARALAGPSEKATAAQHAKGKLTAR
ncbi:methylmalonyl-CoA carboxyltransferase, partial [Streptomyces sp. NPDC096132]